MRMRAVLPVPGDGANMCLVSVLSDMHMRAVLLCGHGSRALRLRYAFLQLRDDSIRLRDALNLMDVLSLQFKIFRSLKII